jgi:AraC-like DNA-binding protein
MAHTGLLQTHLPPLPLAAYVEMLWYWEGYHPPHPKERILPSGVMELTINLSEEPLHVYNAQAACAPQPICGPMVGGARSQPFVIDTARPASILSVWFKPGGARLFFGAAADELHNLHLPLAALWGSSANRLYDQLLEAPTTVARFRVLEGALLGRLARAAERHRAVSYALAAFQAAPRSHTIAEIVRQIALSPTRFIQLFREEIGMSPKLYCRVKRFQAALRLIACQPNPKWAEVALTCGYYDQAHFINEFHAFAGITPTAYAPQSRDHYSNLPVFD